MKRTDYSYEFDVYTQYVKEEVIPVWRVLSDEEKAQFREEYPDVPLIPTKIKVGENTEEVVIRKDALCKLRIPNVLRLTVAEILGPSGRKYNNRFIIQESQQTSYVVKGNYKEFSDYLNNLRSKNKIGFK